MTYNETAGRSCFSRGRWKPLNVVLMVLGFALFWPLGLAMLAYIIWGDELRGRAAEFRADCRAQFGSMFGSGMRRSGNGPFWNAGAFGNTGNAAFDEYREREIRRLEEERRKVETMRAEFESFLRELRLAKDKEEFERFMNEYRNRSTGSDTNGSHNG